MSEKSVIIDGVDVQFCQYFNCKNKKCRTCSYIEGIKYTSYKCEDDRNCYYKQLKRLQEQFEEYKSDIAMGIECITCTKENENCRLQVENERLKAENEELRQIRKDTPDIQQPYVIMYRNLKKELHNLQAENERLKEENKQLEKEVETWNYQADKRAELSNIWFNTAETYKQSLQEIGEIAKEQLQDVSDRCINTTPMYIVHKHIIAKINEVIGAE